MHTKGILVLAQNNDNTDYVLQACALAMSLKASGSKTLISLVTNDIVDDEYIPFFDKIIPIPFNDDAKDSEWKIENRWKLYHATPYDETIVLDTDVLILENIDRVWDYFKNYEMYFTNDVYTYKGEKVTSNFYRDAFVKNNLPNLYSGFHYFKKCDFSYEFYRWVEIVLQNWELFYGNFVKESYPGRPSIDITVALVSKILNCEQDITGLADNFPKFVHMKSQVQNWEEPTSSWQDKVGVYFNNKCELKIGNHLQSGIFHYTENDFLTTDIIIKYKGILNV